MHTVSRTSIEVDPKIHLEILQISQLRGMIVKRVSNRLLRYALDREAAVFDTPPTSTKEQNGK